MKHLGDITKIHGDQIEPVDCITFGSPCQDLSIAGRRAGLAGERSGLFMEAVRIIKEMRSSTNGLHPTFAIWENVPGAFSSNGGEDFRGVLEELARVEQPDVSIPRPPKGKWNKAGAISGDGWSLAWRQLDAQYWGVPQRRKRIALVADFREQRAAEVLFERTSLSRHPDPCIPTPQKVTGAAGSRIAGNDRPVLVLNDQGGEVMGVSYNVTGTLRASEHGHQPIVLESNQVHATVSQTGICPTLPASMGMGGGYIPMITDRKVFDARGNGDGKIVPTITGDHENRITDYTAIAIERKTFNEQSFRSYKESDKCSTLKAKAGSIGNGSECLVAEKIIRWIVRRLTPVECERLQGFPDGWTDIGEWVDSKGKKHKYADSPRYKALGNSIALPQWFWIAQKMKPYLSENATLGSLFDGIGGFPLVWQKTYGNGTARWASEIEEFPIAVTKRRFGEE
jgi:DNA (cytosine-5)-methyltransferase 1